MIWCIIYLQYIKIMDSITFNTYGNRVKQRICRLFFCGALLAKIIKSLRVLSLIIKISVGRTRIPTRGSLLHSTKRLPVEDSFLMERYAIS